MIDWIRLVAPQCFAFHPANGGFRTKSEAARLKWIGVVAGVADLVIIDEHGLVYFLELKSVDGVLSESQVKFRKMCRAARWPYEVCHNVTEASAIFEKWGIPTREHKPR